MLDLIKKGLHYDEEGIVAVCDWITTLQWSGPLNGGI